jgi:hypothetical protein
MKMLVTTMILVFATVIANAQIPVGKDPFHKVVFENEKVRVLDLSVSGTDTTTMHVHKSASVVVFVSRSKLAIQSPGEKPVITDVDIGNTVYRGYDKTPTTHKVWSADSSLMRCIVVEIKE